MVNKKDLRGGAEKMREVAQLLSAWADDLEASGGKKSRKKAAEPSEAVASAVVAAPDVEPEVAAAPAVAAAPVEEPAAAAEIGYEDLRGLLAEKSAAGYRTQVIALINSFGAEKLSGVDPAHFRELWDAAALLGGDGDA